MAVDNIPRGAKRNGWQSKEEYIMRRKKHWIFKSSFQVQRLGKILLLMASALHTPIPGSDAGGVSSILTKELRAKQQCIAEVVEMIHWQAFFMMMYWMMQTPDVV
ncbi:endoglucanase 11-like [Iris pallida]|uniref:Endoglucanase 11-like n=1 Tax=Iris pallida TaxID=29817 RepID=A0AAX6FDP9_IRIPA|nr:endoglucanase 11-like [Iris pallida]